jgi:hypothetical protein
MTIYALVACNNFYASCEPKDGEQVKHTAKKNHAVSPDAASSPVSNDMAAAKRGCYEGRLVQRGYSTGTELVQTWGCCPTF